MSKSCYPNYHMTPLAYAVWSVSTSVSMRWEGKLYFDGRSMAARFKGATKESMYRAVKELVDGGWLEITETNLTSDGRRKRDSRGHYMVTVYKVVSHEDWVETHGATECASLEIKTGENAPVLKSILDQSRNQDTSSLEIKTYVSGKHLSEEYVSEPHFSKEPVSKSRLVVKGETDTLTARDSAAQPVAAPVSKSRQVVQSTTGLLPIQPHERTIAQAILDGRERSNSIYAPWRTKEWAMQLGVASVS